MTTEEYLQQHDLDLAFVKKLGWQLEESRIVIPIYDEKGKLLYCKYRNMSGQKFSFDTGNSPALYASHKIKNEQVVILCEGEADCARLWQAGLPAVTSGSVSSFNEKLASPLKDKDVVVLMDNDEAGQKVIEKYCNVLIQAGALPRIGQLPPGIKDVCDYFAGGGTKKELMDMLNESLNIEDWRELNKPKEYSVLTGESILARDLPEQEWYVSRMVPVEGMTFLIGSEGVGKSFYSLTLGNAVATGEKWLGAFEVKKQTNVLFMDKENTMSGIQKRMKGLRITGKGLFFLEYPEYFDFFDSNGEDGISDFAHYIQQFVEKNNIGMIVIDSFIDFMVGSENSSEDTQGFFSCLKKLLPGKAIVIIHHEGKPSQGVTRTASHKTRGSSNIMAQAFSAFSISPLPRVENQFSVEQTKLRGAQKVKKFKVEMEIHTNAYNKEDTWVLGLRYKGEIEDQELKNSQAEEVIRQALENKPEMPRKELEDLCIAQDVSPRTFQNVLREMTNNKIIESIKDPENKSKRLIILL